MVLLPRAVDFNSSLEKSLLFYELPSLSSSLSIRLVARFWSLDSPSSFFLFHLLFYIAASFVPTTYYIMLMSDRFRFFFFFLIAKYSKVGRLEGWTLETSIPVSEL